MLYKISNGANIPLLDSVDLTEWASPVEDQQHLGSCTAQAIVGAYELLLKKNYSEQFVDLSRLFVYYNSRLLENYVNEDVGAYVHNGIKAVDRFGVCKESIWPYNIHMFAVEPTNIAYNEANNRKLKFYSKVDNPTQIIEALDNGLPVVIGVFLFDGFDQVTKSSPILAMPRAEEETDGGHAMCVTGYDKQKELFKVRNSFGTNWGENGYCYITFDYAQDYFNDCWTFDILLK